MASGKITELPNRNEKPAARELSPRAKVQQELYQRALDLLAMSRTDMRLAIIQLDLETTRKAKLLESRQLRRKDVLALLAQQELMLIMGEDEQAVLFSKKVLEPITNALLLAKEHTRYPLQEPHLQAMRQEIDKALAHLGGQDNG